MLHILHGNPGLDDEVRRRPFAPGSGRVRAEMTVQIDSIFDSQRHIAAPPLLLAGEYVGAAGRGQQVADDSLVVAALGIGELDHVDPAVAAEHGSLLVFGFHRGSHWTPILSSSSEAAAIPRRISVS